MRRVVMVFMVMLAFTSYAFAGAQAYTEYKGVEGGDWTLTTNWSAIGSGAGTWTGQILAPLVLDPLGGPQGAYFGKAGFKASRSDTSPGIYGGTTVGVDQIVIGSGAATAGPTVGGHLNIDGGTVNVSEFLTIGNNNTTAVPETGTFNMNTGILNCGVMIPSTGHLFVGYKGIGTLNMSGGTINLTDYLSLADQYATAATAKGTLNLFGGTIYATDLKLDGLNTGTTITNSSSAHINITNGKLVLNNVSDLSIRLNSWVANGYITTTLPGTIQAVYNPTAHTTTLSVVPEPATICLLGLGVMGLLRRRVK
jgi:hypothetical protein